MNLLVGLHREETFLQLSFPFIHAGHVDQANPRLDIAALENKLGFTFRPGRKAKPSCKGRIVFADPDNPDAEDFHVRLHVAFPYHPLTYKIKLRLGIRTYWNSTAEAAVVRWVEEALADPASSDSSAAEDDDDE